MKAIIYKRYGGPEVLELAEVAAPVPKAGEVLIQVHSASINSADQRMMRAHPFLVRLNNGLFTPRKQVLGVDVAGVVQSVGAGVATFAPGDRVFGETFKALGGFAEFVAVRASMLLKVPPGVSFVDAAAVPLAGLTALQAVRLGQVQAGQSVLIQGAGGGVGTYLVQFARARGARVTAVCGAATAELVRTLGADRVLDYQTQDFTTAAERYQVIFGVNGYQPLSAHKRCLAPGGRYVMVGGSNGQIFEALLLGAARFLFGGKHLAVLTIDDAHREADLHELEAMLGAGTLKPVIDRVFPLEDAQAAFRYVEQGHVRGKVVLQVRAG